MSTPIKDGGPAFPQGERIGDVAVVDGGMSLRDYFAAQALSGSLAGVPGPHLSPTNVARESYAYADAMLRAREVKA